MTATDITHGMNVFFRAADIALMEFLRESYKKAFSNAPVMEAHKQVPILLDIKRVSQKKWFMNDLAYGAIPCVVRKEDFMQDRVIPSAMTADSHIISILTPLFERSSEYVTKREKSFVRRRGWSAYSNMHDPRYYFLLMIQQRLQLLCSLSHKTSAVLHEYDCLHTFIRTVAEEYDKFFPRSHTRQFYRLISKILAYIHQIKKKLREESLRQSLSPILGSMARITLNLRPTMASLLLFMVNNSNAKNQELLMVFAEEKSTGSVDLSVEPRFVRPLKDHLTSAQFQDYIEHYKGLVTVLTLLRYYADLISLFAELVEQHGLHNITHSQQMTQILRHTLKIIPTLKDQVDKHLEAMFTLLFTLSDKTDFMQKNFLQAQAKEIHLKTYFSLLESSVKELNENLNARLLFGDLTLKHDTAFEYEPLPTKLMDQFRQFVLELHTQRIVSHAECDAYLENIPEFSAQFVAKAVPLITDPVSDVIELATPWHSDPNPVGLWYALLSAERDQILLPLIKRLEFQLVPAVIEALTAIEQPAFVHTQLLECYAKIDALPRNAADYRYRGLDLRRFDQWTPLETKLDDFLEETIATIKAQAGKSFYPAMEAGFRDEFPKYFNEVNLRLQDLVTRQQPLITRLSHQNVDSYLQQLVAWRKQGFSVEGMQLMELAQRLAQQQDAQTYRALLAQFATLLATPRYRLCCKRGSSYTLATGDQVSLPRHVVAMLTCYHSMIEQASDVGQMQFVAWQMLNIAKQAAAQKKWRLGHWFGSRHQSTQRLYDGMGEVSNQLMFALQSRK